MPTVIDASFVVAVLFKEEHTPYARQVLRRLASQGFIAPALVLWEVANICAVKYRRGLLTVAEAQGGLDVFLRLPVELEGDPALLPEVLSSALRHGLTAYDAAYLELAARLRGGLATIDRALAEVATAEGVEVHSPFS